MSTTTNNGLSSEGTGEFYHDARRQYVMLACACLLGVGSHFGSYVFGPIKSSIKTSEAGFAALVSSFELLNTVTPLLSGFLVPRYGAAKVGLVATGLVLLGQIIVCLSQDDGHRHGLNMAGTICGLLLFGSGVSPLSVVQETIILSNNTTDSRFVGRSVALGLVLGKFSSFLAAASSDWLHSISPRMPFVVSSLFAAISFSACLVYFYVERHRDQSKRTLHLNNQPRHRHEPINLFAYARFGDPFWLYISVCGFAGIWYSTIHLSTNLLQAVYEVSQHAASQASSILLLSPTFLYPLVGYLLDKKPSLMSTLYSTVPTSIAVSYSILFLLSPVVPYFLAFVPASIGVGIGPLLSVLVVPRIVKQHQASAALALHKSLEMAGGIIFQTLAAFLLAASSSSSDTEPSFPSPDETEENADSTLAFFFLASLVQLALVVTFWRIMRSRGLETSGIEQDKSEATKTLRMRVSTDRLRRSEDRIEEYGLLSDEDVEERDRAAESSGSDEELDDVSASSRIDEAEFRRGKKALRGAGFVVVFSWFCFALNVLR